MDLSIVFSIQKLHRYILMCTTKVVTNSKPIDFLLSQSIINRKYDRWIIIHQEFYFEYVTPKSKKGLTLIEFISDFPTGAPDPLVNDDHLDKHLFTITSYDLW